MNSSCPFNGCFAPELSCGNGEAKLEECPHWKSSLLSEPENEDADAVADSNGEFRFPWTGNVMGAADLNYIAGSMPTRLVTMAGAAEAGKTSLLAAFYLLMARGISPAGVAFAGSLTLEGWENIASNLMWSSQHGPSFPAHTSSGAGRRPGLLHLSLQMQPKWVELLSADAPGEWFSNWAINKNAPQAEGARWLAECSDIIIVIADSQALSGPQRGVARKATVDLMRRIGSEIKGRPVALVWSKSDLSVPTDIVVAVNDGAKRSLGDYAEFHVSLYPAPDSPDQNEGQGILELLRWILSAPAQSYKFETKEAPEKALLRLFGNP